MKILEEKHTIKMHWHFFIEMHGEGAVDGVGATVKCVSRKKFLLEKSKISTAKDLATNNFKMNVILLTEIEKLEINNSLSLNKFYINYIIFKNFTLDV